MLSIVYQSEVNEASTVASSQAGFSTTALGAVVVRNVDFGLTAGTDYTTDADGSGITCVTGSAGCKSGAVLKISYDRLYLDEDVSGRKRSHPGVASAPFVQRPYVPCTAAYRAPTTTASGYLGGTGQVRGGRSTILAFAQGEESFTDTNGNGLYDFGEPFDDLTEAFLDVNEDGVFGDADSGGLGAFRDHANPTCYGPDQPLSTTNPPLNACFQEYGDEDVFIDFNNDTLFNAGNGIYNGILCPKAISDRTDTCNNGTDPCDQATEQYCTRKLVNIRKSIVVLSAGSAAYMGIRESSSGEYMGEMDLSGDPAFGFDAFQNVTTNDGVVLASGADFTVGYGDSQVAPRIGETVYLRASSGGVTVDVGDKFGARLPTGTTISVASISCGIANVPNQTVFNSSGLGMTNVAIGLNIPASPTSVTGSVTVTATTPFGVLTTGDFTCSVN